MKLNPEEMIEELEEKIKTIESSQVGYPEKYGGLVAGINCMITKWRVIMEQKKRGAINQYTL